MAGLTTSSWRGDDLVLDLGGSLDALAASRPELEQFFDANGIDPRVANRIEVIFEELASNAMRHGFRPGGGQSVRVRLTPRPDAIELTFEDDGAPFDPLAHESRPRARSLAEATPGGLGIPLVRKLSASFHYEAPSGQRGEGFQPTNRVVVSVAR